MKMKIKPEHEHLAHMQAKIAPLDTPERRKLYLEGKFPNASKVTNLNMRYRWDLLHAAGLTDWLCKTVYPYGHDEHVDTALRSIVKDLK